MTQLPGSDIISSLKLSSWQHQNRAKWDCGLILAMPNQIIPKMDQQHSSMDTCCQAWGPELEIWDEPIPTSSLLTSICKYACHVIHAGPEVTQGTTMYAWKEAAPLGARGPNTATREKETQSSLLALEKKLLRSQVLCSDGSYQETGELQWNQSVGERTQPHTSLGVLSLFL